MTPPREIFDNPPIKSVWNGISIFKSCGRRPQESLTALFVSSMILERSIDYITHPLFKLFARPVGNRPDCRTAYLRGAITAHYDGARGKLNMQEFSHGIKVLEEALAERPRGLHLIQLWRRCVCHIEEIDLNAI